MNQILGLDVYCEDGVLRPNDPDCMYCVGCVWWSFGILCPCKCYDECDYI